VTVHAVLISTIQVSSVKYVTINVLSALKVRQLAIPVPIIQEADPSVYVKILITTSKQISNVYLVRTLV